MSADLEDIASLRVGAGDDLFYPALAVPLGPGDETLQCPDPHSSLLLGRLADMPKINVLVIGYSGLDTVVAGLLARAGRPLGSLLVIEPDQDRAARAAQELAGALGAAATRDMVFDLGSDGFLVAGMRKGGFSEFVESGGLDHFVERLRSA